MSALAPRSVICIKPSTRLLAAGLLRVSTVWDACRASAAAACDAAETREKK
jgi:hypothetical protein